MNEHDRRKALGDWGERKAVDLLRNAKVPFQKVRDVNAETNNHPFGDVYAERGGQCFIIGVKTRCKHQNQKGGPINETYNIKKKGADVRVIGDRYNAELSWVAIQVVPELQTFNAYFGTIAQIEEVKERFYALRRLLTKLDYSEIDGIFQHPTRKVIFVGDFVDRGPEQREGAVAAEVGERDFYFSGKRRRR